MSGFGTGLHGFSSRCRALPVDRPASDGVSLKLDQMPTLEPDYEQAEEIAFSAIEGNQLSPEMAAWADAAYRDLEHWALFIYDGLRLAGSRIYEREKAATFWKAQWEWTLGRLQKLRQTEQRFIRAGVATPPALVAVIHTTNEIAEACRGAYELVA